MVLQRQSFYDPRSLAARTSLLDQQTNPTAPLVEQLLQSTDLLVPDYQRDRRLDNFSPDLYDLSPYSHLVRFVAVLTGDGGAGSARKRYLVARLQSAFASTHFYDLDRFYGAIFQATRPADERLPIDPYTQTATSYDWETYSGRDTSYRERVMGLAKALPMAGTPVGLQTAAEAITGDQVQVFEAWPYLDDQATHVYSPDPAPPVAFTGDRNEVVVQVKAYYGYSPDGLRQQAEAEYALRRVLNVLKPAGNGLRINFTSYQRHDQVALASVSSDSEFFEVIERVTPTVGGSLDIDALYPVTYEQAAAGVSPADPHVLGVPAFTTGQGAAWSYNNEVVSVVGSVIDSAGAQVSDSNVEYVTDAYGNVLPFPPTQALLSPRQVEAVRLTSQGVLTTAPYAGPRVVVRGNT